MTIEENGTSDVVPEIDTSVPAQDQPEIAEPGSNEAEQQPQEKSEQDDSDKSLKKLQSRIDRVTAKRYQAEAENRHLREQLERLTREAVPQEESQQIRPEDIDRIANQRAQELRDIESVSKRSHEIRADLIKEVGASGFDSVLSIVIEEAGQLADDKGKWTALGEAIADSDKPAQLLKYLADNPDEAASLNGLSAARLGRKLAAIEAELGRAKVSKAPQPLKPVTPKGAPHGKSEQDMSDAEWYRARFKR